MTTYFEVLDKIGVLMKKNKLLSAMLSKRGGTNDDNSLASLANSNSKNILHELLGNVVTNIKRKHKGQRHSKVMKKFATVLYIYAGSMSYEFIQKNLPEAFPSLRTVQSLIHSQYSHIEEGQFRFDELLQHIEIYKSPMVVAVAEDATRIIQKVEYDPSTNR